MYYKAVLWLSVLFILTPFWSFALTLFLLCYRSWKVQEYKVLLFFVALFLALLAYTQFTETGDLSRVYKRILTSDAMSLQRYIVFMLSGSKYILSDWTNLFLYKLTGNVQVVSFFWIFLLYYSFFMGILHILEYKGIEPSWKIMGGLISASLFCFILFTQVTELMKQGVATALIFYSYSCFLVGRQWRALLVAVLSLGIHFSPLFLCPIFLAGKIGRRTLVLLVIASFACRGFNLMSTVANVLSDLGIFPIINKLAEQYEENLDHFFSSSATFFTLTFWVYTLTTLFVFATTCSRHDALAKATILMIVILNLNYSVSHNFTRLLNNMFPFYCMLFIELWRFRRNLLLNRVVLTGFVAATLIINLRIAYERLAPDSSYGTQYMNNSIPKIMFSSAPTYWKEQST